MTEDEIDTLTDRHNRKELMGELQTSGDDRAALQRAIVALMKIGELGDDRRGQWAADVANEVLNTMTCAGEAEEDWIARYHKGQAQVEKLTDRVQELEYALSRVYSAFYVVKEALGGNDD